ncbi:MAG: prolipoprotein diacylglyceryl transferase [Candidatus Woesearchaeota archaeon]|jgi:phosphatidylglycerol:prolipoprotein diacylglycerol transferase|nr:prolipoprotein diacylglyceryl transferase [Candidatus Woesearchaeota archaeon]
MFYHNINPTLIHLGPLQIRYYGLIFVIGFIIAYYMIPYLAKKRNLELTKNDTADLIFYLIIGTIIGARLFYILFYNLPFYLSNPLSIFAVWQGGLSFHGGLVGSITAIYYFCKKKQFNILGLLDIIVIPLSLALMLGRIGNFINAELVGTITSVPWAVKFPGYEGFRHPSQLYESLKNLVIFITLWNIKGKHLKKGILFSTFIIMYSILRFAVGFVRAPDPQLGYIIFNLTMGQLLNIVMFAIGIFFIFRINKKEE